VRTRILTIVLAAVLGLLGVVAVVAYAHQANQRAVAGLHAETVLVANAAIPAGTSLKQARKEHLLTPEEVPASSLSTPPVKSSTDGQLVTTASVAKGQLLLLNMLGNAGSAQTSSSFIIPKGMVAVTVNMCIAEAVASYITPRSHIAVFDTIASKGSTVQRSCDAQHQILNANAIANGAAATRLVLSDAEVLAVGQSPAAQSTSQNNIPAATADPASSATSTNTEVLVTVAVHQADAERLILIDEVGMPYMALLGPQASMSFGGTAQLFQP
jgi:pilus assembly protein CpaB